MKAIASPITLLFEARVSYQVPLFQRQYVWSREAQWEPLWEDIRRKFLDQLHGRRHAPVHFLGAMVLDPLHTAVTHVARRQVIDGQQRLTTLQIFLVALHDYARRREVGELAAKIHRLLRNDGPMEDAKADLYKVWPTQSDRPQFIDVVSGGSVDVLREKYPPTRQKRARRDDPRPSMVEAYFFFSEQLAEFFEGPTAAFGYRPLPERLDECFQALGGALRAVVIELEADDDAQVIFETLNARGEPLLPADLVRNFVFLRAAKAGENVEGLYESYWKRFDQPFWRETVLQGRLSRSRSDQFMQCFLASQRAEDVAASQLFSQYKDWVGTRGDEAGGVEDELRILARHGDHFRRIVAPEANDPLRPLMEFLEIFEVRTSYPLLLVLLDHRARVDWPQVAHLLKAYVVHRAVCGLSSKGYNRVFVELAKKLRGARGDVAVNLRGLMLGLKGASEVWPVHTEFKKAWLNRPVYPSLNNAKLGYLFGKLNAALAGPMGEQFTYHHPLTVEHIMPQGWREHWVLPDGQPGAKLADEDLPADDSVLMATQRRDEMVQTIGNLTLVTQSLNSSNSNGSWAEKKAKLLELSFLPLNHQLRGFEQWNEQSIQTRGEALFKHAWKLWPKP